MSLCEVLLQCQQCDSFTFFVFLHLLIQIFVMIVMLSVCEHKDHPSIFVCLFVLQLFKVPSLPNLFKRSKDSDQEGSSTGAEEETSFSSEYSGGKRVSQS